MSRHIHVIGIGAGDPDYVTIQAIEALNDTQVFFAMDKGEAKSDLVALRREICTRFIREPGYRFVELPDPKRASPGDQHGDYREAVFDWHAARTRIWARAIETELGPDGVGAFLAWGDPSLYDSTLRILDVVAAEVDFTFDVIPGITAVQALTARHRIPLNDVGEPVLITTGRQLRTHAIVRLGGGAARRRLHVSGVPGRHPHLVGRLPGHRRRTAGGGHCRRGRGRASWSCAPRPAPGTAGSWTPIYTGEVSRWTLHGCDRQTGCVPELPEVEALADHLRRHAVGSTIGRVDVARAVRAENLRPADQRPARPDRYRRRALGQIPGPAGRTSCS